MPDIIGVRVHFNDARQPVLHDAGRQFREDADSGVLRVYGEAKVLAVHAAMEWAWAELVHAEPVPAPKQPTITVYSSPTWTSSSIPVRAASEPERVKTPVEVAAERIARRQRDVADAQQTLARAVADAQRARDDLDGAA